MGNVISGFLQAVDSLTNTSKELALSANQGKVLNDKVNLNAKNNRKVINNLHIKYNNATLLDIEPGVCWDDTYTEVIELNSLITKDSTVNWIAGSGNGGTVDSIANGPFTSNAGDTIHAFVIKDSTNNLTDVVLCNYLDPVLPTGYTLKRRVGSIVFEQLNTIRGFQIINDKYLSFTKIISEYSANPIANTNFNIKLLIPTGINLIAIVTIGEYTYYSGTGDVAIVTNPGAILNPSDPLPVSEITVGGIVANWATTSTVTTDTNAQIQLIHNGSGVYEIRAMGTKGFFINR